MKGITFFLDFFKNSIPRLDGRFVFCAGAQIIFLEKKKENEEKERDRRASALTRATDTGNIDLQLVICHVFLFLHFPF